MDNKPFTTFFFGGSAPKPYLHPLRDASGTIITRGYPMEKIEGETTDHPHHRGLWFTHGDVNGLDFWVNEPSPRPDVVAKRGVITTIGTPTFKAKGKSGTIDATFQWATPDGKPLMTEHRVMTFHSGTGDNRMVDFDVTFTAKETVKFGDTKEGFFAVRLKDGLTETKGTGKLRNAEGRTGMKEVWGARSAWVDYSGTLDGKPVGIAIFDHTGNPKHPTFWHARDYGLFAANPFGEHDFLRDKTRNGSETLKPGESMHFRFRVLIHPGKPADYLAGQYTAYSNLK